MPKRIPALNNVPLGNLGVHLDVNLNITYLNIVTPSWQLYSLMQWLLSAGKHPLPHCENGSGMNRGTFCILLIKPMWDVLNKQVRSPEMLPQNIPNLLLMSYHDTTAHLHTSCGVHTAVCFGPIWPT